MTRGGIRVELQPLATDAEGNVLIKARGWIGDTLINKDSPLQIGLAISDTASNYVSYSPRLSYDNKKRAYAEVSWAPLQIGNPDDAGSLMLWTPMEPLPADAPRPERLKVNLTVALAIESRMRGTLGGNDRCLLQQKMEIPIMLPSPGEPLPQRMGDFVKASVLERLKTSSLEPFDAQIFYTRMGTYRNMGRSDVTWKRYLFWADRYTAAGVSELVQMEREALANAYLEADNRTRAVEVLNAIMNDPRFQEAPPIGRTIPPWWKGSREGWEEERRRWSENNARRYAEYRERAWEALKRLGEPVK
jgi:hypothetical protein